MPDYLAGLSGGVRGLKIGVDRTFNSEGVDKTVIKAVDGAVDVLRRLGAEIKDIAVPSTTDVLAGWLNFCAVETAVAHEKTYPSRADQYGPALAGLIIVTWGEAPAFAVNAFSYLIFIAALVIPRDRRATSRRRAFSLTIRA